jgi:hypothetical protein
MPRGRPKNLSTYEKTKVRKLRENLSKHQISRFDKMNDSSLLRAIRIDSSGKVYVSLDLFDAQIRQIKKIIAEIE